MCIITLKLIRLKGQLLLLNHGLTHNFLRNLDYDPKFSNAAIQFFKNHKSELIQPLLFVIMIKDLHKKVQIILFTKEGQHKIINKNLRWISDGN